MRLDANYDEFSGRKSGGFSSPLPSLSFLSLVQVFNILRLIPWRMFIREHYNLWRSTILYRSTFFLIVGMFEVKMTLFRSRRWPYPWPMNVERSFGACGVEACLVQIKFEGDDEVIYPNPSILTLQSKLKYVHYKYLEWSVVPYMKYSSSSRLSVTSIVDS